VRGVLVLVNATKKEAGTMTKKHFEGIARVLNESADKDHWNIEVDKLLPKLIEYFERENPRFNATLFYKAVLNGFNRHPRYN
jgi:hypothetical protein